MGADGLADDKKKDKDTSSTSASPGPVVNQLDDKARETFATGRPLEDVPDSQQCKHCKKSLLKTAMKTHVIACLKLKKEKLQRKKELKEAREREKKAGKEEDKDDEGDTKMDDSGDEGDALPEKKAAGGIKSTKKSAGKKLDFDDKKGKKRKAEGDAEKGPKQKKKKEEPKAKIPKQKGKYCVRYVLKIYMAVGQGQHLLGTSSTIIERISISGVYLGHSEFTSQLLGLGRIFLAYRKSSRRLRIASEIQRMFVYRLSHEIPICETYFQAQR